MTSARTLLLALAALALEGLPSPAAAQGCARVPRAHAGNDVAACIGAVGTTDFALTAAGSLSAPLNGPIVEYCWSTPFGVFLPSGSDTACFTDTEVILRVPNTPGRTVFAATLTVTDAAGCTAQDDVTLDLSTPPVLTRTEGSSGDICFGSPLDLLASAVNTFAVSGLVRYAWDTDVSLDSNGNGFAGDDEDLVVTGVSGRLTVATFTPVRQGTFTARLTASAAGDPCMATADVAYVVETAPIVRLVVGPVTACPNEPGRFQGELAFGDTGSDLTWDFDTSVDSDGNGVPFDDVEASGQQVTHAWPESGTFTMRVTALGTNDCIGFEDRDIEIRSAPVPAFTTSGPACSPLAVTFTDASQGTAPLTVSWTFGDGSAIESGPSRTHVFAQPGRYTVSHVVTDDRGCTTSETRTIDVFPTATVIEGVTMFDGQPGTDSAGNANGFADPGERLRFVVDVRNAGASPSGALTATLTTLEPDGLLVIDDATAEIGFLEAGERGGTADPHLQAHLSSSTPCGAVMAAEVRVAAGASGTCSSILPLTLRVGAPALARIGAEMPVLSAVGIAQPADAAFAGGVHAVLLLDETTGAARSRLVRLSVNGAHVGDDVLVDDVAGASVRAPQIAWSEEDATLASAWISVEPGAPGNLAARFRRLDGGANPVGVSRRIDLSGHVGTIDLAWASDHWLVAWTDRAAPGAAAQLWAQVVTADGLLLGTPLALGSTTTDDGAVRVAASGDRVLVGHRTGDELRLFTVEGLRPAMITDQDTLSVAAGVPSVARFGSGFLVAFESGGGIDLAWVPSSGSIARSTAAATGQGPSLAGNSELAVVAWTSGSDVLARVVGGTGRATGAALLVTPGADAASLPALSASDEGLLLASFASRGAPGTIVARATVLGPGTPEGCATGVPGDVAPAPGGDGRVDIGDVVLALRAAVGLATITPELLARGDVAPGERVGTEHRVIGDGVIDIADAVVLLQASTGLITIVP